MGASESSTRKVSFGLDEGDRVRVLHGAKLSQEALERMRESTRGTDFVPSSSDSRKDDPGPPPPPPAADSQPGPTPTETQGELRRRPEMEATTFQDELARLAQREREVARQELTRAVLRERARTHEEAQKAGALAKQLEKKEGELRLLDASYQEHLAQLERKNLEFYRVTGKQFEEAADRIDAHVRPRSTEAVCPHLQHQLLQCYRGNQGQALGCSSLAKEYLQCVNAMKKELLLNHT